jgi:hypothetical protein
MTAIVQYPGRSLTKVQAGDGGSATKMRIWLGLLS